MSKPYSEPEQNPESPQPSSETRESSGPGRRRRSRPSHLEPSVNMDELRELIALIQENGFAEFELERQGFRLHVRRDFDATAGAAAGSNSAAQETRTPVAAEAAASAVKGQTTPEHFGSRAATAASEDQDLHMIPSPIVGTFYRAASPNSDPFVKIGSNVEPDSIVCIIEAMKLMNEIQAETSGEVVKIYVENGQPVEYGQPLFGIRK
ncbi:MAG: acetyl-CoA carboxylase biotin carboxyl carrier protein [Pyrinomonadaceae bacterium]